MAASRPGIPGADEQSIERSGPAPPKFAGLSPQAFNGIVLDDVSVPASVIAGQTFTVSGVIGWDWWPTGTEGRVVASTASGTERIDNVGNIPPGESKPFRIEIPAPQQPGDTVIVRLKGQNNKPIEGWSTWDTSGPHEINVVTSGQKTQQQALQVAPWVVGGGAIGAGVGRVNPQEIGMLPGTAIGVGVGASAYALSNQNILPRFTFPTTQVLAAAGLLGAGALFLAQTGEVTGLGD